jgi:chorismate dehydratase
MRIGAVNYLNSKPLVCGLEALAPGVRVTYDLPSRLADSLAAGRLDVALVPSVEFFRGAGYRIVSDACVACRGPVLSVKLFFRVPPNRVCRVALDEGSRTSSALTQIVLAELCGVWPQWETLPIGEGLSASDADAVLLIGDRAIQKAEGGGRKVEGRLESSPPSPAPSPYCDVWDLGERWCRWTGLPFVFAMWIARADVDVSEVQSVLGAARDEGVRRAAELASREAAALGISSGLALEYLRDTLHFTLGVPECAGLRRFYELCVAHDLAPGGLERTIDESIANGCAAR